jgi:hypothetical protein
LQRQSVPNLGVIAANRAILMDIFAPVCDSTLGRKIIRKAVV